MPSNLDDLIEVTSGQCVVAFMVLVDRIDVKIVPRFSYRSLAVWLASPVHHIRRYVKKDIAVPQLQRVHTTPPENDFSCSNINLLEASILNIALNITIVRRQIDLFQIVDTIYEALPRLSRLHFVRVREAQTSQCSNGFDDWRVRVVKNMICSVDVGQIRKGRLTPA